MTINLEEIVYLHCHQQGISFYLKSHSYFDYLQYIDNLLSV